MSDEAVQQIAREQLHKAVQRIAHYSNIGAIACEERDKHANAIAEIACVLEAMETAVMSLNAAPTVLTVVAKTLQELRTEELAQIEQVVRKARAVLDDFDNTPEELRQ